MVDVSLLSFGRSGPDVVFVHGFGGDRLTWAATTPALGTSRVHTVDLPGHGNAGLGVGDGSVEGLAEGLIDSVETNVGRPVHFVGHSLGASLGLLIARQRPDLVQSLFLIAPAGLGVGVDFDFLRDYGALETTDQATALLARLVFRPELISREIVDYALGHLNKEGVRDALAQIAAGIAAGEEALAGAAQAVAQQDVRRTVVWGGADRINPPDPAKLTAFGDHEVLPDVGHLPHVEAPAQVNKRLVGFVAEAAGVS